MDKYEQTVAELKKMELKPYWLNPNILQTEKVRIEVSDLPGTLQAMFLRESPALKDVEVQFAVDQGKEYLFMNGGNGSSDGFPKVSVCL